MRKSSREAHGINLRAARREIPAKPLCVSNCTPSEGSITTDSVYRNISVQCALEVKVYVLAPLDLGGACVRIQKQHHG